MEQLEKFKKPEVLLPLINALIVIASIILWNFQYLPLGRGETIFIGFLLLAFSLYRPKWAFWLFIGCVPLEIINLLPEDLGVQLRPYQIMGVFAGIGLIARTFSQKKSLKLFSWIWVDSALLVFIAVGFLSAFFSADVFASMKQSIVAGSFVFLYFVIRAFIKSKKDIVDILPYFFGSSMIVMLYSIAQNWSFMRYGFGFETMPGRPNGTFIEADWLGMFIAFVVAIALACFFALHGKLSRKASLAKIFLYELLVIACMVLILTVARSAWLGALGAVVVFLALSLIQTHLQTHPEQLWKRFLHSFTLTISSFVIALVFVFGLQLTNFELTNRLQSTSSGLQEITIACEQDIELPSEIKELSELELYDCQHIDLEEIDTFIASGQSVKKIYRDDPNVNIRKEIWGTSWDLIEQYPLLGIGWGSIGQHLGTDGQGTQLNASNIFLEIWLGTGLLGLLCFIAIALYFFWRGMRLLRSGDADKKVFGAAIFLSSAAIFIPNLFNSGQFLGFFWVWLAIVTSSIVIYTGKTPKRLSKNSPKIKNGEKKCRFLNSY